MSLFRTLTTSSGGISVSTVTDSSGNAYKRAGIIQNKTNSNYPAEEIWYADNVPANSALTVTVTFNSRTGFFFTAMDISDVSSNGSLDAVSGGQTGQYYLKLRSYRNNQSERPHHH